MSFETSVFPILSILKGRLILYFLGKIEWQGLFEWQVSYYLAAIVTSMMFMDEQTEAQMIK